MIAAAVTLFARGGFNGITTKDIAHCANVSEGNIFRYFPHKRDLFLTAIDSELGKLSARAQCLSEFESFDGPKAAMQQLFQMITNTVVSQPELVRLLHFGTLEFAPDMEPLFRKHLDPILTASADNLKHWSNSSGFRDVNPQVTVLSFVATLVLLQHYHLFTGKALPYQSIQAAASEYAELWYRVISTAPADSLPESDVLTSAGKSLGVSHV